MLQVSEIFMSIQGESTYVGIPCTFIRLAGCNLSCNWCDTEYAREPASGKETAQEDIVAEVKKLSPWLVEITGGEPCLQDGTAALADDLLASGYVVLIETNGSVTLAGLAERVIKIVDVKCPSSGHVGSFLMENIDHLSREDEVKFVIADRADYDFAKRFIEEHIKDATDKLLFAPVKPRLTPRELADWILTDGLRVRLQVQLHSYIWDGEQEEGTKKGEKKSED